MKQKRQTRIWSHFQKNVFASRTRSIRPPDFQCIMLLVWRWIWWCFEENYTGLARCGLRQQRRLQWGMTWILREAHCPHPNHWSPPLFHSSLLVFLFLFPFVLFCIFTFSCLAALYLVRFSNWPYRVGWGTWLLYTYLMHWFIVNSEPFRPVLLTHLPNIELSLVLNYHISLRAVKMWLRARGTLYDVDL